MVTAHPSTLCVGCAVEDSSTTCPTGGGFERVGWSVKVNDGWLTTSELARRGHVGSVSLDIEEEDDPYRAASGGHWGNRPAQVHYRRTTLIRAPVGTHFRKRVETPVRDPVRGVWYRVSVSEYELRGEGRLISLKVLAERRAQQRNSPPVPLPQEAARTCISGLLAQLDVSTEALRGNLAPRPTRRT